MQSGFEQRDGPTRYVLGQRVVALERLALVTSVADIGQDLREVIWAQSEAFCSFF